MPRSAPVCTSESANRSATSTMMPAAKSPIPMVAARRLAVVNVPR